MSYKQEYLKSHKSVEKFREEKLEDMSMTSKWCAPYASGPELKKVDMEQRAKGLEAKSKRENEEKEKKRL